MSLQDISLHYLYVFFLFSISKISKHYIWKFKDFEQDLIITKQAIAMFCTKLRKPYNSMQLLWHNPLDTKIFWNLFERYIW